MSTDGTGSGLGCGRNQIVPMKCAVLQAVQSLLECHWHRVYRLYHPLKNWQKNDLKISVKCLCLPRPQFLYSGQFVGGWRGGTGPAGQAGVQAERRAGGGSLCRHCPRCQGQVQYVHYVMPKIMEPKLYMCRNFMRYKMFCFSVGLFFFASFVSLCDYLFGCLSMSFLVW